MTGRGKGGAVAVDAILEAARRRRPTSRGGHSPLYDYLWDHYEALAPGLNPPRRPYWDGVAACLAELHPGEAAAKVARGNGDPPNGERVRKAWWQVRRDRTRLAEGAASRAHPAAARQAPVPVAASAAKAAAAPVRPASPAPAAAAAAAGEDVTDVLQFAGGRKA